jgi:DNA-binding transcriptional LysR family regulator
VKLISFVHEVEDQFVKLQDLEAFVEVAGLGSFGLAAERLHLTQPAVSQRIISLERDLKVRLFERSTRRVTLTATGAQLLGRAHAIVAEVHRAEAAAWMLSEGHSGQVSVGFVGTATYELLPRVTRRIRSELPDIELQVHGEQLSPSLLDRLLAGDLDLAILRNPPTHVDLDTQLLRSEQLVAAVPSDSDWAGRKTIRLSQLSEQTFISYPRHPASAMYDTMLEACRQAGFRPAATIEVRETSTLVTFVAAGLGVAVVPEPVRTLALAGVRYLPITDSDIRTDLVLAASRRNPLAAVARVAALIRDTARA